MPDPWWQREREMSRAGKKRKRKITVAHIQMQRCAWWVLHSLHFTKPHMNNTISFFSVIVYDHTLVTDLHSISSPFPSRSFAPFISLFVFPLESFHHSHSASLPEVTEGKHGAVDWSMNITSGFFVYLQAEPQPGISPQSRFAVHSTQSVFTFLRCWRAFCAPEFRFAAAVSAVLAFRSERKEMDSG